MASGYTSILVLYFSLSNVVSARRFSVLNIHYFVTCSGYVIPGGCVFTLKFANVFVRTLLF